LSDTRPQISIADVEVHSIDGTKLSLGSRIEVPTIVILARYYG
jgi:hypothetical protein